MIIVSDTSPISGLYRIHRLHLLNDLFGKVILPHAVMQELTALKKWGYDLAEIAQAPWIEVRSVVASPYLNQLKLVLDDGEAEAIALAKELGADLLLIDERKGRRIAQTEGLRMVGVLAVLIEAKNTGLISTVKLPLDELIANTRFRISDSLYKSVLARVKE